MEPEGLTVRDLRRRWKPIKNGAASVDRHKWIRIRLHRCWSWMRRIEELPRGSAGFDDARLIYGWIALNSLFGRWDEQEREPVSDRLAVSEFLVRVVSLDRDRLIPGLLTRHGSLAEAIAGDEYLSRYFWREPSEEQVRRAQACGVRVAAWASEERYGRVLDLVLQRVYVARCQLMHGGATSEGQLNRRSIARCADFLGVLLPTVSVVIVDHAWDQDWGGLCYPPMWSGRGEAEEMEGEVSG